jgi:hypothetical protein
MLRTAACLFGLERSGDFYYIDHTIGNLSGEPMSYSLARIALAVVFALVSAVALVGVSGMIVFADLSAPRPSQLAADALSRTPAVSRLRD